MNKNKQARFNEINEVLLSKIVNFTFIELPNNPSLIEDKDLIEFVSSWAKILNKLKDNISEMDENQGEINRLIGESEIYLPLLLEYYEKVEPDYSKPLQDALSGMHIEHLHDNLEDMVSFLNSLKD